MGLFSRIGKALSNFFTREPVKPTKRQGVGGSMAVGGFLIQQERAPDLASPIVRYKSFNEAVLNNPTIGASVWLFLRTIIQPEWEVEPAEDGGTEAEEIAELLDEVIHDMRIPWYRVVRQAALFKLMGFAVMERIAKKREDGAIGFDSIERRPCFTIEQWDIDDETGIVEGFGQRDPMFGTMHYIPRSKCVYLVDDSLTDSPDGTGILRLAFEPNRTHRRFEQLEGWIYELDARGMPIGYAPLGALDELVSDGKLSAAQRDARIKPIKDIVKNHVKNPGLGLVIDSAMYRANDAAQSISSAPLYKLDLLRGDAGDSAGIDEAIKRKAFEVARLFCTTHLLLGGDGKGSLALSKSQRDMFIDLVRSTLGEIEECFDDDIVDDWMEMNDFDMALKPKLRANRQALAALDEYVDNLVKMSGAGAYMPADDPAWDLARKMMDAPPAPEMPPPITGQLVRPGGGAMPPGAGGPPTVMGPNGQPIAVDPNAVDIDVSDLDPGDGNSATKQPTGSDMPPNDNTDEEGDKEPKPSRAKEPKKMRKRRPPM